MKRLFLPMWIALFGMFLPITLPAESAATTSSPKVRIVTSMGAIVIELDAKRAPISTRNFLKYASNNFYNNTIFHRVIPGFMIQGGGFEPGMKQKPTDEPIQNEADNGLKNLAGTIAMARTMDPHSASAQFFINTVDNAMLDHSAKTTQGWGYAVFGKVVKGMDVVKKIESVSTRNTGPFDNVPVKNIVIQKTELIAPTK